MMKKLKILNTRESKEILNKIEELYGCRLELDNAFVKDQSNRIYLISRDADKISLEKLRISVMGLYFAEINKFSELRLTIEGSQIVGPLAKKNVAGLSKEQVAEYFKGNEIEINLTENLFYILKLGNDYLGAAKYKYGKLLNYLPKVHRAEELIL